MRKVYIIWKDSKLTSSQESEIVYTTLSSNKALKQFKLLFDSCIEKYNSTKLKNNEDNYGTNINCDLMQVETTTESGIKYTYKLKQYVLA